LPRPYFCRWNYTFQKGTSKSNTTMSTQGTNYQNSEYHKEVCWAHCYTYCTRQICQQPTTLQ
jgi:hypothetical protein